MMNDFKLFNSTTQGFGWLGNRIVAALAMPGALQVMLVVYVACKVQDLRCKWRA